MDNCIERAQMRGNVLVDSSGRMLLGSDIVAWGLVRQGGNEPES